MMAAPGTSQWRATYWGAGCYRPDLVTADWIIGAGKITCHKDAVQAFRALGRIFRLCHYQVRTDVTGCYNCRAITGGSVLSAHAQGIALDVNWDTNPYRRDTVVTDFPPGLVAMAVGLRTVTGEVVLRWGGDWDGRPETPQSNYDSMHWELINTPAALRNTLPVPAFVRADPWTWPLLGLNERGPAVEQLQHLLTTALPPGASVTVDGIFGPLTLGAVQTYQRFRQLAPDGVVGLATWTALLTSQPATLISPSKAT